MNLPNSSHYCTYVNNLFFSLKFNPHCLHLFCISLTSMFFLRSNISPSSEKFPPNSAESYSLF